MEIEKQVVTKYIDQFGLVHDKPNDVSENGILFASYYRAINPNHNLGMAIIVTEYQKDGKTWYQANPPEKGEHFSHDNMLGLYAAHLFMGLDISDLPIFKWNGKVWWHPRDWLTHIALKGYFPTLISLILIPFMLFSFRSNIDDVSGRLKWFLRSLLLEKYFKTKILSDLFIANLMKQYNGSLIKLFRYYFKNEDHPANLYLRGRSDT